MAERKRGKQNNVASRWEHVVGALGALLVAATIGYLALDAKNDDESPPDLVVSAARVIQGESGYIVEIEVDNRGTETAAAVLVRGELKQGDSVIEDAEATLDYVPGHSRRPAGLVFTRDPASYTLHLRTVGFDVP